MERLHMGWLGWPSLLAPVMTLAVCSAALAQVPDYNLGRTPTEDEIRAWDISISPDGKGLPQGAKLYALRADDLRSYCFPAL